MLIHTKGDAHHFSVEASACEAIVLENGGCPRHSAAKTSMISFPTLGASRNLLPLAFALALLCAPAEGSLLSECLDDPCCCVPALDKGCGGPECDPAGCEDKYGNPVACDPDGGGGGGGGGGAGCYDASGNPIDCPDGCNPSPCPDGCYDENGNQVDCPDGGCTDGNGDPVVCPDPCDPNDPDCEPDPCDPADPNCDPDPCDPNDPNCDPDPCDPNDPNCDPDPCDPNDPNCDPDDPNDPDDPPVPCEDKYRNPVACDDPACYYGYCCDPESPNYAPAVAEAAGCSAQHPCEDCVDELNEINSNGFVCNCMWNDTPAPPLDDPNYDDWERCIPIVFEDDDRCGGKCKADDEVIILGECYPPECCYEATGDLLQIYLCKDDIHTQSCFECEAAETLGPGGSQMLCYPPPIEY